MHRGVMLAEFLRAVYGALEMDDRFVRGIPDCYGSAARATLKADGWREAVSEYHDLTLMVATPDRSFVAGICEHPARRDWLGFVGLFVPWSSGLSRAQKFRTLHDRRVDVTLDNVGKYPGQPACLIYVEDFVRLSDLNGHFNIQTVLQCSGLDALRRFLHSFVDERIFAAPDIVTALRQYDLLPS